MFSAAFTFGGWFLVQTTQYLSYWPRVLHLYGENCNYDFFSYEFGWNISFKTTCRIKWFCGIVLTQERFPVVYHEFGFCTWEKLLHKQSILVFFYIFQPLTCFTILSSNAIASFFSGFFFSLILWFFFFFFYLLIMFLYFWSTLCHIVVIVILNLTVIFYNIVSIVHVYAYICNIHIQCLINWLNWGFHFYFFGDLYFNMFQRECNMDGCAFGERNISLGRFSL